MKATTYSATGTKASAPTTLDKNVFNVIPESTDLLAQVYETSRHNARTINAYAKTRGEVRGGGKKPWKQKGTGRARAGTIRSPLWRGGGITFGPTGEIATKKLSKNSKKTALKQALSLCAKNDGVFIIKKLPETGKTKDLAELLDKTNLSRRTVLVTEVENPEVKRASANIPGVTLTTADRLSVNEVLDSDNVVFEDKAVAKVVSRLGGKNE